MPTAADIVTRKKKMESVRWPLLALWQRCGDFFQPDKADFVRVYGLGAERRQELFTGTPEHAAEISAAGLLGMVANPETRWGWVTTVETTDDLAALKWLEEASETTLAIINQVESRFYDHFYAVILDMLVWGPGYMLVQPSTKNIVEYSWCHPRDLLLAENSGGEVDTVYMPYKLTLRQLMDMQAKVEARGLAFTMPETLAQKISTGANLDEEIRVIHAVEPHLKPTGGGGPDSMAFYGCFVDEESKTEMFREGYEENPFIGDRWKRAGKDAYGRSPGIKALGLSQMLNTNRAMQMAASEIAVAPPLQMYNEGVYSVDISSSAVNILSRQDSKIEKIDVLGDFTPSAAIDQQLVQEIRECFFIDIFQTQDRTERTATEAQYRHDAIMRAEAPGIYRVQKVAGSAFMRTMMIALRSGWLPPLPASLRNQKIKMGFASPISRIMREEDVRQINALMDDAIHAAQVDPHAVLAIDAAAGLRELHKLRGAPVSMLRDEEAVKGMVQQQQQQAAMQQELMAAQTGAKAAKDAHAAGMV